MKSSTATLSSDEAIIETDRKYRSLPPRREHLIRAWDYRAAVAVAKPRHRVLLFGHSMSVAAATMSIIGTVAAACAVVAVPLLMATVRWIGNLPILSQPPVTDTTEEPTEPVTTEERETETETESDTGTESESDSRSPTEPYTWTFTDQTNGHTVFSGYAPTGLKLTVEATVVPGENSTRDPEAFTAAALHGKLRLRPRREEVQRFLSDDPGYPIDAH